ncbi:thiamine-phosphate kinase [Lihuaxuella thermophila]|uniref:Thiamine-monophosphate kinase n=1 Tax=Lihuaxuella thermophila TaxID=1173111 RepID=A0A1H8G7G7_9BACL|nr:thiamine-phosphate kinase [Lihuaxuella thermophila]SEN39684.1 thiamine-monophosphate kinase [Lihuaxuella thermophila]
MNDEFAFIRSMLAGRTRWSGRIEVDVGDDAAVVLPSSGRSLVMTCDTMVETVHFLRETMMGQDIGWKLMASNLSDIAAMGAVPTFALLSVAVPPGWPMSEIEEIYRGLYECADRYHVTLMGGDTVRTPGPLLLTLTLLGEGMPGKALRRSAAQPGDLIFVTGTLGNSAAGLSLLLHQPAMKSRFPALIQAHCRPVPQLEIGKWLAECGLHPACDDVSDGLAQEAWEIAEASRVRLVIEQEKLPLSDECVQFAREMNKNPYDWAWYGGEDYQLIGTIHPKGWEGLKRIAAELKVPVTVIGKVEAGEACVEAELQGKRIPLPRKGYNHFADR